MFSRPSTRRLLPILMAALCASLLTACAASTPSARAGIALGPLPADLTHCTTPVDLPGAALSRADVERLWARDRVALTRCGANLEALVTYYEDLARRLSGAQ